MRLKSSGCYYCAECNRRRERARYPIIKERMRVYQKAYYQDHKEYVQARTLRWFKENQEREQAKRRAYNKAHRSQTAEYCRRARAKRRGVVLGATAREVREKILAQNGVCFDCGQKAKLTAGHLIPLMLGGSHMLHNIVGQCYPCNRKQWKSIHPRAEVTMFDLVAI